MGQPPRWENLWCGLELYTYTMPKE